MWVVLNVHRKRTFWWHTLNEGGDKQVSWWSKKQDYTSMSLAEAEVILFSTHSDEWKSFRSQPETALRVVVKLLDPKLKTMGERGIECIFAGYADHYKDFRFYVIEPNESVTDKVVQQPEHKLRKSKRNRTPKNFGPEFQLYLIKGTRDEVSNQHLYCFNFEDDPKTFDKAMKSQDVAFWKEAIKDDIDSIWATTLGCWPIYLQFVNLLVANGSLKEN
ncbi:hypothetical protein Tco_0530835 [Tanacetum coccineum]